MQRVREDELENLIVNKAEEIFDKNLADRVIGWTKGDFFYDNSPAVFKNKEELENFVYNDFCACNLSKYLIGESKKGGKIAIFCKPCDTFSLNELIKEHRINRENVYVVGIECQGKLDIEKVRANGISGITAIKSEGFKLKIDTIYGKEELDKYKVYQTKCETCKSKDFAVFDEKIVLHEMVADKNARFAEVEKLENMTADERFAFWKGELSKCIRCNACRNVCPACSCTTCVFDNPDSNVSSKANSDSFEEKNYHIIRAFHVAGRCTDCGECTRVCPEHIPLHLINRKFIKDINRLYGEYQAGETTDPKTPLTNFTTEDPNPGKESR